jgi:hypothetical protein
MRVSLLCGTAVLLFLAAPVSADGAHCSLKNLGACENTNELIWNKGFERALAAFIGNRETEYLYEGGRLTDEVTEVLGGPPDEPIDFDGRYLFTACRAHSCTEKGAAVLRKDGQIDAVAVVWYPCAGKNRIDQKCGYSATLSIFMRDPTDAILIERLKAWINAEFAKYEPGLLPRERLDHVRIYRRPDPIK